MPATKTPAELTARLADAREEMFSFLADLGTDDLEPAERAAFEEWVCELHIEIEQILVELEQLSVLVHSTDGLATPASKSALSKSERAKVLRLAREARYAARAIMAKPDDVFAAARKLRDVRAAVWSDAVLDEAEHLGRAILALTEQRQTERLAWRMRSVSFSGPNSAADIASMQANSIRAGLTSMTPSQLVAFDALVKSGRVTLRPEIAQEHQRAMIRWVRDRVAA